MRRALLVVAVAVLAGCGGQQASTPTQPEIDLIPGCDPVYYERPGIPQVVVVSDLPLTGPDRTAMGQSTQAIKLTLKNRDFRAGRTSVGYVSCSDSGAAGTWNAKTCRDNAQAFARRARVVAMIGTFDSGCMRAELPTLNAAGLVAVSPFNTAPDLTRNPRFRHRGVSYVRLVADEEMQASAAAAYARFTGARAVAAVGDDTPYARPLLRAFRTAAAGEGLEVVKRGADAVYVAGLLSHRTRALLRDARRRGRMLILAEGLGTIGQLTAEVGDLAEGAAMTVGGLPPERAGDAARKFEGEFESKLGFPPQPFAVYAAQAAQIVLDAIAASHATRAAVRRSVLGARIRNGLVGAFSFGPTGEIVPAPVTILRVRNGHAVIERVLRSGVP